MSQLMTRFVLGARLSQCGDGTHCRYVCEFITNLEAEYHALDCYDQSWGQYGHMQRLMLKFKGKGTKLGHRQGLH